MKPNQAVSTYDGHVLRINKYGFRGPDYEWTKKPGTLRLEVFGGSSALCYKAAGEEKTWPKALELKLQARLGMPVEVINLALAGYDSFNSKINYLCFGRAFGPDAIIVYHTWNDLGCMRAAENTPYEAVGTHESQRPIWLRLARRTQLGRRAHLALTAVLRREDDIRSRAAEDSGRDLDRPVSAIGLAWERRNFLDFVTWARNDGVLPILVTQAGLASPENMNDPAIRQKFAGGCINRGYTIPRAVDTWLQVSSMITEIAREHDAILVDGYNAVPHDLAHVEDNVHLTDAGAEVLAEKIAGNLLSDPRFLHLADRVRAESSAMHGPSQP